MNQRDSEMYNDLINEHEQLSNLLDTCNAQARKAKAQREAAYNRPLSLFAKLAQFLRSFH